MEDPRKLDHIILRTKRTNTCNKPRGFVSGYRDSRVMPREDHAPSNGGKHLGPIVFISEENLINIWHQGVPRFVKKICDMYGSFIWALFPLKLEFQIEGKVGNGLPKSAKDMLEFRPILVAKSKINTTKVISDTIRRSFGPKLDVPLWHPGITKRDLFFIVGPSTWHTTRIRLDFLRFISYSLRYQVYAVPGLAFGSRLVQNALRSRGEPIGRYPRDTGSLKYLYVVAATCFFFTWFSSLANLTPLIPNQNPLGSLCILMFALSLDAVVSLIVVGIIKVLKHLGMGSSKLLPKATKPFVALICFALPFHDLLPFILTVAYLFLLSVLDDKKAICISGNFLLPVDWLLLLLYAMLPLVIAMSGGHVFGYQHREIYSLVSNERLMIMLTSISIIFSWSRSKGVSSAAKLGHWSLETILLVLLGEYVALASLEGLNYIPPMLITGISIYFVIKVQKNRSPKT